MAQLKDTVISGSLRVTESLLANNSTITQVIRMPYNNLTYNILDNYNNGNIVLNAASGYLYLGYANTQMLNFLNDTAILSNTELTMGINISLKKGDVDLKSATNGLSNNVDRYLRILDKNGYDFALFQGIATTDGSVHLYLGLNNRNTSGTAVGWAGIMLSQSKTNNTITYGVANPENFRSAISALGLGGGTMTGDITFSATGTTGNASGIKWSGSSDSASIYYSVPEADKGILVLDVEDDANASIFFSNCGSTKLAIDGTYVWTYAPIYNSQANGTTTSDGIGAVLLCGKVAGNTGIFNGNGDGPGNNGTADLIIKSWYGIGFVDGGTNAGMTASINCRTGEITGVKVWGAQWNDYAECRMAHETEPGRCVMESSVGMIRTTKRLTPGCKIVSDTYGLCMGKTDAAKTPIAVAGRVLAYPTRAREEYELGAAVCSGPNGTVDIMTREEIMMYPERIVGTVSEIPTYEIWHAGSKEVPQDIQVDGRIWIYVR